MFCIQPDAGSDSIAHAGSDALAHRSADAEVRWSIRCRASSPCSLWITRIETSAASAPHIADRGEWYLLRTRFVRAQPDAISDSCSYAVPDP